MTRGVALQVVENGLVEIVCCGQLAGSNCTQMKMILFASSIEIWWGISVFEMEAPFLG